LIQGSVNIAPRIAKMNVPEFAAGLFEVQVVLSRIFFCIVYGVDEQHHRTKEVS